MRIVTGTQMKKIDQQTIEYYGITGLSLMEAAGTAVFEEVTGNIANESEPFVVVVCGAGNNGGDGYVAARLLHEARIHTRVYSTSDPDALTGDARSNYEAYARLNLPVRRLDDGDERPETATRTHGADSRSNFSSDIRKASLIVDGILGTGINRPVSGVISNIIDEINLSGTKVVSIDIPSGVGGDDGALYGAAVNASSTVTFQAPKLGCLIYPGAGCTGHLVIQDIGIPADIIDKLSDELFLIDEAFVRQYIKRRGRDLHKGNFGKVMIIAGSSGMAGAAALCARAALRSGAGLVRIAVTPDILAIEQMLVPEATCIPREDALSELERHDAVVIGPGLGSGAMTLELIRGIMMQENLTAVIDADGLNAIQHDPAILAGAKARLILTPHPGEAARLLGKTSSEINSDRLGSARRLSALTRSAVVLKGASSVVALPDGSLYVNPTGNPGMATAGSGDILAGVIASLAAQGVPWDRAAQAGAYLHGLAGDIMAGQLGEYGLIASDMNVGIALAIESIIKGSI